jgi:hypothetical protein
MTLVRAPPRSASRGRRIIHLLWSQPTHLDACYLCNLLSTQELFCWVAEELQAWHLNANLSPNAHSGSSQEGMVSPWPASETRRVSVSRPRRNASSRSDRMILASETTSLSTEAGKQTSLPTSEQISKAKTTCTEHSP